MKLKIDSGVNSVNLSHLMKYVEWHHLKAWLDLPPGEAYYQLLAYLSSQLPDNSKVTDFGTQFGSSALALSYNPNVQVTTYDIADYIPAGKPSFRDIPNIQGKMGNCFDFVDDFVSSSIIFLDISPHNGEDERRMVDMLLEREYKGLLVCDDTNLSDEMKAFFEGVKLKKVDVTGYGHWSGTGIIVFDPDTIDVEVS